MQVTVAIVFGFVASLGIPVAAQAPAPKSVEIVSVTGCLRERGADTWVVVAATDPVPSLANAATGKEIPTTAPDGKGSVRLIGTTEFGVASHRDRTVVVRGLLIKAAPMNRLNLT